MTIKIYKDNNRLVIHDLDAKKLYNFTCGEVWYQMVDGELQLLRGQSVLFGGRTYTTVKDFAGNDYTWPIDIHNYLSTALFSPLSASSSDYYEFSLPAGVGGQFTVQDPQTTGQSLEMVVMTYETGTNYNLYGMRKFAILTNPNAVLGYQLINQLNGNNVANITGIFKDANGNLIINVNAAPWPITFSVKLFVLSNL